MSHYRDKYRLLYTKTNTMITDLHNSLLINKDNGGLCYPTPYQVKIITAVEKIVHQHTKVGDTNKQAIQKLTYDVLNQIVGPPNNFLQHG